MAWVIPDTPNPQGAEVASACRFHICNASNQTRLLWNLTPLACVEAFRCCRRHWSALTPQITGTQLQWGHTLHASGRWVLDRIQQPWQPPCLHTRHGPQRQWTLLRSNLSAMCWFNSRPRARRASRVNGGHVLENRWKVLDVGMMKKMLPGQVPQNWPAAFKTWASTLVFPSTFTTWQRRSFGILASSQFTLVDLSVSSSDISSTYGDISWSSDAGEASIDYRRPDQGQHHVQHVLPWPSQQRAMESSPTDSHLSGNSHLSKKSGLSSLPRLTSISRLSSGHDLPRARLSFLSCLSAIDQVGGLG